MNKLITKIIGVALGVSMVIGAGIVASAKNESVQARAYDKIVTFADVYSNSDTPTEYDGDGFSIQFNKGTNSNVPKYYSTGSAMRLYGSNYMVVIADSGNFSQIDLTFDSGESSNAITTDSETYSNGTWTGNANSVKFTVGGTSGHRRIKSVAVTFATSSLTLSIAIFSGTYLDNYILPGQTGSFTPSWSSTAPSYNEGTVTWSVDPSSAFSSFNSSTGAFTASSSITAKTTVSVGLTIVDNDSNEYTAVNKTVYVCPHLLSGTTTVSYSSLKTSFTIDDEFGIQQTGAQLKPTFLDLGQIDVFSNQYEDYLNNAIITATINGKDFNIGDKLTKAQNGKGCVVHYTYEGITANTQSFTITVGDKTVDHPSLEPGWNLVTDANDLQENDIVIIAASDYNYAISTTQATNNRTATSITKTNQPPDIR